MAGKREKVNFAGLINKRIVKAPVTKILATWILFACFVAIAPCCRAQSVRDSVQGNTQNDSVKTANTSPESNTGADETTNAVVKPQKFQPNPKKAGLYSALIPGLGQLYNRQYWKVPLVYAGVAAAGYFFIDNLTNYQSYRKAYIGRINNPNPTDKYVGRYDENQLQQLQNDYSKYLDLTALLSTVGYALQVLDAITSAHLKNFDISRDISMRMVPVAMPHGVGLGLVVNF